MSSDVFALVLLAGLAVGGVVAYVKWRGEQARREQLLGWATANGWRFAATNTVITNGLNHHPFDEGDHRRSGNVITGSHGGRDFSAFDYSYRTHQQTGSGGREATTHHFAVCTVVLPTYLPDLVVTPENMLMRVGQSMGLSDLELESDEFNRAFRVQAGDPKFASDVLPARTMQLLLAHRGISLRIDGRFLVGWRQGETSIAGISDQLAALCGVAAGIPDFVRRDYGAQPAVG